MRHTSKTSLHLNKESVKSSVLFCPKTQQVFKTTRNKNKKKNVWVVYNLLWVKYFKDNICKAFIFGLFIY